MKRIEDFLVDLGALLHQYDASVHMNPQDHTITFEVMGDALTGKFQTATFAGIVKLVHVQRKDCKIRKYGENA
jgi:hypothetical protein